MTPQLKELLLLIRQHPGFQELLASIEAPAIKPFRVSEMAKPQHEDWIFRSGRAQQNEIWRAFLTDANSPTGE